MLILARVADIQPGQVVCDPMAGTGSTLIEAATGYQPHAYGDLYIMCNMILFLF